MDDFLVMDIDEPLNQMVKVVLQLGFCDSFAALDHFVERVVTTDLQNNVYVFTVLEYVIEKQYIFVLQALMNLDLCHQLH